MSNNIEHRAFFDSKANEGARTEQPVKHKANEMLVGIVIFYVVLFVALGIYAASTQVKPKTIDLSKPQPPNYTPFYEKTSKPTN